ncbi:MAG: EAL domain-containing protein, partial [Wenzhouxiangella sp.]|nr:EAL domain-containing protein [Wenzhouxiangella sp.]
QRLQDVLEATETATWEWNVQTGEARFSRRWAEIIGYTLEELEPISIQTWADYSHPDDLTRSDELLKEHFEGRSSLYSHEARMKHKSGEWVWVFDRGRLIEWTADGKPLWMYGTHQDITEKKQAEQDREEALLKLRKLTDNVPGTIYQFRLWPDGSATLPFATPGMLDVYGISPEAVQKDAGELLRQIHPDDLERVMKSIWHSFQTLTTWKSEHRAIPDGRTVVWLEGVAEPEPQSDGSVLWNGYIHDVTDRKAYETQLRESASVFQSANEGIFVTDLEGAILEVNEAFCEITGYDRSEVIGKNPRILDSGRQTQDFYRAMFEALENEGRWAAEVWNRRKDGRLFAARQTVSVIHDESGQPARYVSLFADITELKENAEKLRRLAERDPLTGLPNRLELAHQLTRSIRSALDAGTPLAVAYIDLDGFKAVNDDFGHPVGDQILKISGERLAGSFRQSDVLGRIGGDEFVAIIEQVPAGASMQRIMSRVLEDMQQPIQLGDQTFHLSASIGLAWLPEQESLDGDQLIRQADQAMYEAKQAGRNCFRVFDAEHDHQVREVHSLVAEVRSGLVARDFVLYYQPKVNMETGEIIGAEALIRWQHPERGLLTPYEFLPQIEGQGVMKTMGHWVIMEAASQVCQWKQQGYQIPVSINIDGFTLLQPDFVQTLKHCLEEYADLKDGDMTIEVLETSALQDINRVHRVMAECASLGFGFAIDDFGTGYSSLTYLKRLPAAMLKIDASFVRDMLEDPDDLSILSAILGLAKSFKRECIAEGVETVQHGLLLLASGCVLGQGYAIARPMPAADLPGWLDFWRPPPVWRNHGELIGGGSGALFAFVEHNAWMKQFRRFMAAPRQAGLPPLSETECALGCWLRGQSEVSDQGLPDALVEAHDELHRVACRIASQLGRKKQPAELPMVEEIDQCHARLVKEFERYLSIQLQ